MEDDGICDRLFSCVNVQLCLYMDAVKTHLSLAGGLQGHSLLHSGAEDCPRGTQDFRPCGQSAEHTLVAILSLECGVLSSAASIPIVGSREWQVFPIGD